MAEQTFKSPGFFEREIEIISRPLFKNNATPVGLIGPSQRGPAFVPTTVTSREEYIRIFGAPDRNRLSGHAMAEFFRNDGKALTFCRTLGSGLKDSANAGFKMTAKNGAGSDFSGSPHLIVAEHTVNVGEHLGLGMFNDNDSHATDFNLSGAGVSSSQDAAGATVELIRAMIFTHKDYKLVISAIGTFNAATETSQTDGLFNLRFTDGTNNTDIIQVSLDPGSDKYIRNALNTDPFSLEEKKHLLYAHFPVDSQVASTTGTQKVAVVTGKDQTHADYYGNFSTRFNAPQTTKFISQPFGSKEFDLFHFESLDDGAYASGKYKVSIKNMRASTDPTDKFGTFTVAIRDLRDTDESQIVYETFSNCSLDPDAKNFIARVIGDEKVYFNFDATSSDERRLVREGSFSSKSSRVRIVMSDDVLNREVPDEALPFGFRGVPSLLSNSLGIDSVKDATNAATIFLDGATTTALDQSVLPPLPYRFKVTTGTIKTGDKYGQEFLGDASPSETVNTSLHWGLMSTKVKDINNANSGKDFNEILENYTKFFGVSTTVISSGNLSDTHNNNKFSLAKVALKGASLTSVEGTISEVFKHAVYVRNADISKSTMYDVAQNLIKMAGSTDDIDSSANRVSLAKLLDEDKTKFNRYSSMIKFTAPFHGGFDGLNMFDKDSFFMTDQSSSTETNGKAVVGGFSSALKGTDDTTVMQGEQDDNNIIASYKNAIRIMTDELVVTHNVLAIPGIRDSFITDFAKERTEEYGRALYLMEIPQYDGSDVRIFVSSNGVESSRPDVDTTASRFNAREINSSYTASYFPDVKVIDSGDDDEAAINNRRVIKVPPTIVALGALAKTDSVSKPWFAPAGFSRGALESVSSIDVRLNAEDRDTLYEARINPIANFPNKQFVIFGQKTSQLARTALDRVNVRRLVLEVKRRIGLIAQGLLFEQNNNATRQNFIASAASQLASIQINQGIEDFRVVMDDTNNSVEDVDNNRLNGKIIIVPTRAIEFIAIDFVITNAGVEFP